MKKDLESRGMTVMISKTPEDFAAWIADATERYKTIIRDANISMQ